MWSQELTCTQKLQSHDAGNELESENPEALDLHVYQIAFTAKISVREIPSVDFISHCEDDMNRTFEKTPATSEQLDATSIRSLYVNVPVAAQWILHCGERVSKLDEELYCRSGPLQGLWKGRQGFSRER